MSDPPIVDFGRAARRVRTSAAGARARSRWSGGWSPAWWAAGSTPPTSGRGPALALAGMFLVEVVVVGGSALRGMLRAGDRGERLAGGDVGPAPAAADRTRGAPRAPARRRGGGRGVSPRELPVVSDLGARRQARLVDARLAVVAGHAGRARRPGRRCSRPAAGPARTCCSCETRPPTRPPCARPPPCSAGSPTTTGRCSCSPTCRAWPPTSVPTACRSGRPRSIPTTPVASVGPTC